MLGLYTPKTIRKVRENVEVKRNSRRCEKIRQP